MQNKILNIEPAYLSSLSLTTMAFTLLNCAITALTGPTGYTQTQPYIILKHMRINNALTTSAVSVTLYKGTSTVSSAGATAFGWDNVSLPAQSYLDWVGQARLDSVDFLNGIASLPQAVVINIDGEIGLA